MSSVQLLRVVLVMNNIYNDLIFSPVCSYEHSDASYIGVAETRDWNICSRDFSGEIDALRSDFERLREDMYLVLLKLQECSRKDNLVDDEGGALDDFIARFVRR